MQKQMNVGDNQSEIIFIHLINVIISIITIVIM